MTKIYTKTGDGGETSLFGGGRVTKDCVTMRVVGEVDELNSVLGVAAACLSVDFSELKKQIDISLLLKKNAEKFAADSGHIDELKLLKLIETLTPQVFSKVKGVKRPICANVDLYSGFVYKMLNIPEDLYTPLFTVARIAGWAAHRIEELLTGGRIIRPAYKSVTIPRDYVPLAERTDDFEGSTQEYVPTEERIAAGD